MTLTTSKFLDILKTTEDGGGIELSPGPLRIRTSHVDRMAGEILSQLDARVTDDTRLRDTEAILFWNLLRQIEQAIDDLKAQGLEDSESLDNQVWYSDPVRAYMYAWWWLVLLGSLADETHEPPNHR